MSYHRPNHAAPVLAVLSYPVWVTLVVMLIGTTAEDMAWGYLVGAGLSALTGVLIWACGRLLQAWRS